MTAAAASLQLDRSQAEAAKKKFSTGSGVVAKFFLVLFLQDEGIKFLEGVENLNWKGVYDLLGDMIAGNTMDMSKEMREQADFSFLGGSNTAAARQKTTTPQNALLALTSAVVPYKEVAPLWMIGEKGSGRVQAGYGCKKLIDEVSLRVQALHLCHAAWKVWSHRAVARTSSESMVKATAAMFLPKPETPVTPDSAKEALYRDDGGTFQQFKDDLEIVLALFKDEAAASESPPTPSSIDMADLLTAKNPMYPLMLLLISMPLVRYEGQADSVFDPAQVRGLAAQVLDCWHSKFPELQSSVQELHFSSTQCARTSQREQKQQKQAAEIAAKKREEEAAEKRRAAEEELSKKTERHRAQQLNQEQETRLSAVKLLQDEVQRRENSVPAEKNMYLEFVVHAAEPENTPVATQSIESNPGLALVVLDDVPTKFWPPPAQTFKSMEATFKAGKNACFAVAVAHEAFSNGQALSDFLRQSKAGVVQGVPYVIGTTLGSLSLKHTSGGGNFNDSDKDSWKGHDADGGALDQIIVFSFFATASALQRFNENWASTFRGKGRTVQDGREHAFLGDGRSFMDQNVPWQFFSHERSSLRFNLSAWTGGEKDGANVQKGFDFPRELAYGEFINSMGWGANNPSSSSGYPKPVWFLRGQTVGAYALFSAQDGGVPVVFGPLKALTQDPASQVPEADASQHSVQYRTMADLAWAFHPDNFTYFAQGYSRTTAVMLLRKIAAMCSAPDVDSLRRRRYFLQAHTPTLKLRHGGTGNFALKTGEDYVKTTRQRLAATGVKGLPIKPLVEGRKREQGAFLMPAAKYNATDSEVLAFVCSS